MKQKRIGLNNVDMKYIRDLQNVDDNVPSVSPQIQKSNRPFIGILILCDEHQYCVPLNSPKEKHKTMKNAVDFTRIFHNDRLIGILNFNNMIPVDERFVQKIDIKIKPTDSPKEKYYKGLCQNELTWCQKNQKSIIDKANKLYDLVQQPNCSIQLKKRCNDFKELEKILAQKGKKK